MTFKHFRLLAPLLLTLAATALASTTWYVNGVTGSDTNNCLSPTVACKTIGHAISLASSGDTIRVAAATYAENLTIGISLSILGAGASTTIIDGGGIDRVAFTSGPHVTISNVTIQNGDGGIANAATLVLNNTIVTGNHVHVRCSHLHCGASGAGIYNTGTLTINNSTVSSNSIRSPVPSGSAVLGGGIYNGGRVVISRSTINNNGGGCPVCAWFGAGVYNDVGAALTLTNATLSGNDAQGGGSYGGAINNQDGKTLTMNNSTISGNNAAKGGGVYGGGTLQNSIVANNTGGNCYYAMISNGYNLSSDATCDFSGPGDMNNTDPMLGPLQNNGGPTQTMALQEGSPAIDAGNPAGCTDSHGHLLKTDQRGFSRPDKEDTGGCDIGAYELSHQ